MHTKVIWGWCSTMYITESLVRPLQGDLDKLGWWAQSWQMVFDPSRCYKMSVYRSRSPVLKCYKPFIQVLSLFSNIPTLESCDLMIYRGIWIITRLWKKLIQPLVLSNGICYVTLIRPHLEFVSAVWDPYWQDQIDKIEAVQRQAAWFIKNITTGIPVYRKCCIRCP